MKRFSQTLIALALLAFVGSMLPAAVQAQVEEQERQQEQQTDSIVGTIAERQNGALLVETEDGQRMTFHVDEQTRVVDRTGQAREQEQDPLEILRSGENVVVHYRSGEEPTEYVATSIELRDPGEADQQDQQQAQQDQQQRTQQQQQAQQRQQQDQQRMQQNQQNQQQEQREDLPATSGNLPLVAGLGLLGLLAALGLGYTARREH